MGRTMWEWYRGDYTLIDDSPWTRRPIPERRIEFHRPKNYRGDWIVTTRRGNAMAHGRSMDMVLDIACKGTARALWEWTGDKYECHPLPERETAIKHFGMRYKRPVEPREEWLVVAASGRVWSRSARMDDVLESWVGGYRRALWQLVSGQYVLRGIDGKWLDMGEAK